MTDAWRSDASHHGEDCTLIRPIDGLKGILFMGSFRRFFASLGVWGGLGQGFIAFYDGDAHGEF